MAYGYGGLIGLPYQVGHASGTWGGTGAVTARRLLRPTYILREDVAIDGAVVFQEI